MRKLLFLLFIGLSLTTFGQQQQPQQPQQQITLQPPHFIFVVPLQMSTDTIKNGLDTVKLTNATTEEMKETMADSNYVVTLTPIANCGALNLLKITSYYFIVKEQGAASPKAIFDYIVYANQPRPWKPSQPRPKQ